MTWNEEYAPFFFELLHTVASFSEKFKNELLEHNNWLWYVDNFYFSGPRGKCYAQLEVAILDFMEQDAGVREIILKKAMQGKKRRDRMCLPQIVTIHKALAEGDGQMKLIEMFCDTWCGFEHVCRAALCLLNSLMTAMEYRHLDLRSMQQPCGFDAALADVRLKAEEAIECLKLLDFLMSKATSGQGDSALAETIFVNNSQFSKIVRFAVEVDMEHAKTTRETNTEGNAEALFLPSCGEEHSAVILILIEKLIRVFFERSEPQCLAKIAIFIYSQAENFVSHGLVTIGGTGSFPPLPALFRRGAAFKIVSDLLEHLLANLTVFQDIGGAWYDLSAALGILMLIHLYSAAARKDWVFFSSRCKILVQWSKISGSLENQVLQCMLEHRGMLPSFFVSIAGLLEEGEDELRGLSRNVDAEVLKEFFTIIAIELDDRANRANAQTEAYDHDPQLKVEDIVTINERIRTVLERL